MPPSLLPTDSDEHDGCISLDDDTIATILWANSAQPASEKHNPLPSPQRLAPVKHSPLPSPRRLAPVPEEVEDIQGDDTPRSVETAISESLRELYLCTQRLPDSTVAPPFELEPLLSSDSPFKDNRISAISLDLKPEPPRASQDNQSDSSLSKPPSVTSSIVPKDTDMPRDSHQSSQRRFAVYAELPKPEQPAAESQEKTDYAKELKGIQEESSDTEEVQDIQPASKQLEGDNQVHVRRDGVHKITSVPVVAKPKLNALNSGNSKKAVAAGVTFELGPPGRRSGAARTRPLDEQDERGSDPNQTALPVKINAEKRLSQRLKDFGRVSKKKVTRSLRKPWTALLKRP